MKRQSESILKEIERCLKKGHKYFTHNNITKCVYCNHIKNEYEIKENTKQKGE